MPHSFPANRFLRHFNAAAVADNSFVSDSFVLAAMAFPIAYWSKNLLAEESILFWTEGPIVDRLRLGHLTMLTIQNIIRRSELDHDPPKVLPDNLVGLCVHGDPSMLMFLNLLTTTSP